MLMLAGLALDLTLQSLGAVLAALAALASRDGGATGGCTFCSTVWPTWRPRASLCMLRLQHLGAVRSPGTVGLARTIDGRRSPQRRSRPGSRRGQPDPRGTPAIASDWSSPWRGLAAGGLVTGYPRGPAGGRPIGIVDLGALATLRRECLPPTLLVAWRRAARRFREWVWLVYPLLVLVGLKMVAQDFKHSRPATLFIALALYGIALIVAPRLRRHARGGALATPRPNEEPRAVNGRTARDPRQECATMHEQGKPPCACLNR